MSDERIDDIRMKMRMLSTAKRSSTPKATRAPFTMLEILAVLTVVVIIGGMTLTILPALSSSGVDSGSRVLSTQLQLARQHAITKRKYVAVILPSSNFKDNDAPTNQDHINEGRYRGVSCRPCIVDLVASVYQFDSWVLNSEWIYMPPRAFIGVHTALTDVADVEFVRADGGSETVSAVPAVIFKPNGSLISGADIDMIVSDGDRSKVGAGFWREATVYRSGEHVHSSAGDLYEVTNAGTSHLTTEPSWNTTVGDTTIDNSVTWTRVENLDDLDEHYRRTFTLKWLTGRIEFTN